MTAEGRRVMVRVLVLLLVVLTGCSAQPHEPRVSPSPSDRSQEIGAAIDAYVAERQYGATRAVLVSHRGRLVAERYYGSHVDDHAEVRSVTKSVMAALVGAALREGRLPSIDATLGDLLPQHRSIMDARTERITLRQLLSQTAGYTDKQTDDIDPHRPVVPQLLKPGPQNPPGAGFEYQDGGPHLLSAVIAQVTGQTTLNYARRVLFEPLDIQTRPAYQGSLFDVDKPEVEKIKTFSWLRDHEGIHCGSFGLKLTGRDLVKLGELYRQNGVYNGYRILEESFVSEATRAQSGDLPGFDYGYLWWVTPIGTDTGLQRHRTVRPTGPCGSKPPASGRHLQWLLSAGARAGGAAVDGRNGHPAPTALGDQYKQRGCAARQRKVPQCCQVIPRLGRW